MVPANADQDPALAQVVASMPVRKAPAVDDSAWRQHMTTP